jgi:hypothetical protein
MLEVRSVDDAWQHVLSVGEVQVKAHKAAANGHGIGIIANR